MRSISGVIKSQALVYLIVAAAVVTAIVVVVSLDATGEKGSGLDKEYVYNIEDKMKIDPALILYAETAGRIVTGFRRAYAVAVDEDGLIYAAGDNSVRLFDDSGKLQKEIQLDGGPRCLAVSNGKIYIGTKNQIKVYDHKTGQITSWQGLNDDAVLTSIAVSENNVFAADAGNRIVLRYDSEGNLINRIGKKNKDRNVPGFVIPSPYFDLAVSADGLLRVVNPGRHRIEAYTFEGDLEFWWGKYSANVEGFCGCCNPVNFAILEDGGFVTVEKGLTRAKIYDPEGNFVGVVAGPEQLAEEFEAKICQIPANCQVGGFDVAVDSRGGVLVLDTIKNVIRIFAKK